MNPFQGIVRSLGLLIGVGLGLLAQAQSYQLSITVLDAPPTWLERQRLSWKQEQLDSAAVSVELQHVLRYLHGRGYLMASVDTIFWSPKEAEAYLMRGERYEWAHLLNGNISEDLLSAVGYRERFYENSPFSYKELTRLQEKILDYLDNHGYPFAQVYLDSIRVENTQIAARIYCDQGPLMTFGPLEVTGKSRSGRKERAGGKKVRIQTGFLSSYLGIKEGKLYSEKLVQKLQTRLQALRYLQSYQAPYIVFQDNDATVNLFLMDRPSSRIDVLLGLLPSQDPVTQQQRFDFTGTIDIDLVNPFGTGKRLQFQYEQLTLGVSDLLLRFQYPYLFQTPLGVDASFKLYRRDSSFIDIVGNVGLQYFFNGNSYLKAFWQNTTTNLINIDLERVRQTRRLPNQLDLQNSAFGVEFYYDGLDYLYNPRKGFEASFTGSVAFKQVRRNTQIEELQDPQDTSFDFGSLYDTLATNSVQYRFLAKYSHFIGLWKWSTVMFRYQGGLVWSQAPIYDNETFRIGGTQRLRGFDEESIFATWYNIVTLEWRFLFGRNSYAYVFGDIGYVERRTVGFDTRDVPYGVGVGVALETKVGIFALSYALGSQQSNPIQFNSGKVHFGYVYAF